MTQARSYVAGLVTGMVVAGTVAFVGLKATAAEDRVIPETSIAPARAQGGARMPEPHVKVLLENAQVRVREVTFAPGSGDTHTHQWAHVGVILTKGQLAFADAGAKAEETVNFEAGSVGFREAKVTHMARNPGRNEMKVIEVEVK